MRGLCRNLNEKSKTIAEITNRIYQLLYTFTRTRCDDIKKQQNIDNKETYDQKKKYKILKKQHTDSSKWPTTTDHFD